MRWRAVRQIHVVEVEVEQVHVPGGLERILHIFGHDLPGDGQGGLLGIVVDIPVFGPAQLVVLLGQDLVEERGGQRIAGLNAAGRIRLR